MEIRKSTLEDLNAILDIYARAREKMRLSGNPDQWRRSFPPEELVRDDIAEGISYTVTEGGEVVGVFVFTIGDDHTYKAIEDGQWLNSEPYGVIHRIAGSARAKGVLRYCLKFCEEKIADIRIDTHQNNIIMRHLLESCGYKKCGRIYVADGSPRIAYQKAKQI